MKTSILTMAIASSFILGACHSTFEQKTQNVQTELAQSTSEPELGIFGLELAARNVTIKPVALGMTILKCHRIKHVMVLFLS
jgi:putative endopeptidase